MHVVVGLHDGDSSGPRVCTINSMQQPFCISLLMVSLKVQLYVYIPYFYGLLYWDCPKLLCSPNRCQSREVGPKCTDVCSCNGAEHNESCDNDADDDDDHESSDVDNVDDDHDDDDDDKEEEEENKEEENEGDE